ncbi:acetyltransferase [Escherichia coli]|nr:acetyltransferase [Escherichia coli]
MMCLKYPKPEVMTEVMPGGSVFFLPPQGKPGVADLAQPHLQRLRSQLERRLGTLHRVVCQPQRVGQSSSVVRDSRRGVWRGASSADSRGHESWPSEEEYRHPRWYIQVVDAVDLFYLLLWLCDGGQEA